MTFRRVAVILFVAVLGTFGISPMKGNAAPGDIVAFAGGGVGDGGAAANAAVNPVGLTRDGAGNIYIADTAHCRVRKVASGTITTIAGTGTCGYNGDGIAATTADLNYPWGVATDTSGNVYISETSSCRIRKVQAGVIATIAGTGTCGYNGDGIAATTAELNFPVGLAVDASGAVYIADANNCRIRKVVSGVIATIAGTGVCGYDFDGVAGTSAELNVPTDVALDGSGNVYLADMSNCRVRRLTGGMIIGTIAGSGVCGFSGDGTATTVELNMPRFVTTVGADVYIADTANCRVREVTAGLMTTVAGTGTCGYNGDGISAASADLGTPAGVGTTASGDLLIADALNCRVRQVSSGTIMTIAGAGAGGLGGCWFAGDGGPATNGTFSFAIDAASSGGSVYVADKSNCRIRKVSAGLLSTVAGNGTCGYSGDGGLATSAAVGSPFSVATDAAGNLYLSSNNWVGPDTCAVREVSAGLITTVAGNGTCGSPSGEGVSATSVSIEPFGVAVDLSGNVYFTDAVTCKVYVVAGGLIASVAGNGTCGYSGDGAATAQSLKYPWGVAVDAGGNVYIADTWNCLVRRVSSGTMTTIAGNGSCGFTGDGVATAVSLGHLQDVGVDSAGDVYVVDNDACRIRKVSAGMLTTIAGTGTCGDNGDGGPALAADISPWAFGVSSGACGADIFVVGNNRVRQIVGPGVGPDADCDGVPDATDNCPTAPNPGQLNTDVSALSNGPTVAGDDTTDPNHNVAGDACNPDLDNDARPDAQELAGTGCASASGDGKTEANVTSIGYNAISGSPPPSHPSWDTDGDTVPDGIECQVGTDPKTFNATDRSACATFFGSSDADGDGLTAAVEKCKWNTNPNVPDTDGDGMGDCKEAYDVNGNGTMNTADATLALRAFFLLDIGDLAAEDVNGNGAVNTADATLIKRAFFGLDPCM